MILGLSEEEPSEPNTALLNVSLVGAMYTTRLAAWYFGRQKSVDPCIILISSIMAYIDTQGSSVYSAAKHGVRGLMACLRRKKTIRINCIAPWYVCLFPLRIFALNPHLLHWMSNHSDSQS